MYKGLRIIIVAVSNSMDNKKCTFLFLTVIQDTSEEVLKILH